MLDWSTPIHKEEKTKSGYHLKVYVDDPYYYAEVFKDGKQINSHLLTDDTDDLRKLCKEYETK